MSSGARFKFQGSQISIQTGYEGSPGVAITAITKAAPPVVSAAAHGMLAGDAGRITDVVGMVEVNNRLYIADGVTAGTLKLFDADSTGYTTYASGGRLDPAVMSPWCEITSFNRAGGTAPEIAASTVCSTRQEFERGLSDLGTVEIGFNYAPNTAIQTALDTYEQTGEPIAVKLRLPNDGGGYVVIGYVQRTGETGAVNQLWTGSMTLRLTGAKYRLS